MHVIKRLGWALPFAGVLLACREQLTAPASCPALCPGNQTVLDTVLDATPSGDTSFVGYVTAGQGSSLRVSDSLPGTEDRAAFRFTPRVDSVFVSSDSAYHQFNVDSVQLGVSVLQRDTLVKGLYLFLYRLSPTLDSSWTFDSVENQLTPATLVDSIMLDDTLATGRLTITIRDSVGLSKLSFTVLDSTRLAIGVRIQAQAPTGVRIGGAISGSLAPSFVSFVHVQTPDTTQQLRTIARGVSFNTFVTRNLPVPNPDLLGIGGVPSERALIRFSIPPFIRDSTILIRATLELVPTSAYLGLPGDSVFIIVRGLLSDLGAKSPTTTAIRSPELILGSADTLRIEMVHLAQTWEGATPLPSGLFLTLTPEGSSFTRAEYFSSRSPSGRPRLRLTYALRYPFERP